MLRAAGRCRKVRAELAARAATSDRSSLLELGSGAGGRRQGGVLDVMSRRDHVRTSKGLKYDGL
jgi:hypothetical protein